MFIFGTHFKIRGAHVGSFDPNCGSDPVWRGLFGELVVLVVLYCENFQEPWPALHGEKAQ